MELVEGETLEARLRRGPLAIADVFRLGAQIASALAEAHARGITHRDLKPGNIMLGRNGVKVLDFGLAAMAGDDDRITKVGLVIGRRSLPRAGAAPRRGRRTDDGHLRVRGGVARDDDRAPAGVAPRSPDRARHRTGAARARRGALPRRGPHLAVAECRRDPRVARVVDTGTDVAGNRTAVVARNRAVVVLAAAAVVAAGAVWSRPGGAKPAATRLAASIAPPPGTSFRVAENFEGGFALSPDGTMLAFIGYADGQARLWIRRLDSLDARALPGTERAYSPFWSPDSKSVAFFTTAPPELKRIDVAGGAPVTIAATLPNVSGGAWSADGTLILGDPAGRALLRVPASGGEPKPLGEGIVGRYPHFLPGAERFIYLAPGNPAADAGVLMLHALDASGPPRRLGEARVVAAILGRPPGLVPRRASDGAAVRPRYGNAVR